MDGAGCYRWLWTRRVGEFAVLSGGFVEGLFACAMGAVIVEGFVVVNDDQRATRSSFTTTNLAIVPYGESNVAIRAPAKSVLAFGVS